MEAPKNLRKIAIVSGSLFKQLKGGAEYQLMLLSNYMIANNYVIYNVFRNSGSSVQDTYRSINYDYPTRKIFSLLFGGSFFPYVFNILKQLYKIKPDIILARPGGAFVGICAIYCWLTSTKMIWHISIQDDLEKFKWRLRPRIFTDFIEKQIFNYGIRKSHYIVGQAEYQNNLLKKHFKRACDLIIPNFHPSNKKPVEKCYDNINIVWIANIKKQKRHKYFVKLSKELSCFPNIEFYMAGRCDEKKIVDDLNASTNLSFLGEISIDEVNSLMRKSHIFVNTSASEGFPNTFIQAWLNKMVVVSLTVNPDDVLTENNIGFVAHNFDNLKVIISDLVQNPELIKQKGEIAYTYAEANHSLQNMAKYENFISSIVSGQR